MTQEYSRACLRVAVAQMCQHLGWNSIHTTPLELLTDVLERYLVQLGKVSHRYSEQFGRTYGRMEDVLMAFTHMGVEVHELQDYVNHVDALPFAKDVVSFPAPQENDLKFPNPDSKEVQQRKVFEYIPEYLPYMHPELNEEPEDTNQSARPSSPERLQVEQPQMVEMSPTAGEKRPVSSPGDGSIPFKRQRLTTSQPLPEEASQSQYEMTSVVMTHSGILSPIREGKVPDSKPPPAGFKQIVIVRPRQKSKTPAEGSVVKLDIVKDATKGSKIVEVGDGQTPRSEFDRSDPDYKPKAKKKLKDIKRLEKLQAKPFKVKRGPGRPRSPARAAVVHNKGASGFSRIPAMSNVGEAENSTAANLEAPIDLTMKPTPPMPNISVVKVGDNSDEKDSKILDYRPKNTLLSKQQEKDYEDTIDSVIGKNAADSSFESREPSRDHLSAVTKEKKSNKDEWRVSHISETYDGEENDDHDDDDDDDRVKVGDSFPRPDTGIPYPYTKPPATIAPHLKFLFPSATPTTTISPSRPRGRPRGSGSGFYKNSVQRSPMGGRRGRPPLHRGSPGRPPLSSVGRPSLNRSPGRPPLNRSPGRPPLNRSPGRPSTGRSPGRPKGSGLSPRPRGRPRGSKSPRSRGASPRGGSPRAAIANLTFDEEEANDSNDSKKTNIFKLDNDDSEATLFEFPSKSSPQSETRKEKSVTPVGPGSPPDRSLSIPSPAPTEPAGSTGSPDISPIMSPSSDHSLPSKREHTPEMNTSVKSEPDLIEQSYLARELIKDVKPIEMERKMHVEKSHRESSERERSVKEISRERDWGHREHMEHSRDRDRERDRDSHRERDKEIHRERDKDSHRERDKDIHRERDKDSHRERDKEIHRERDKDSHRERDKEIHRERDKDSHKERDRDSHKERDKDSHRERDKDSHRERDKDRDRERSKEHRKDKKKKKKKNKERDRDKERTDEKDRKERHKERKEERREREKEKDKEVKKEIKKEVREESPSIQPLQKLKIKFGGSSSSPSSFSISTSQTAASPKPETSSPAQRLEIPKLKFKMLPPKPDSVDEGDQSWVSSIKKEPSSSTNSPSMHSSPASRSISPSRRADIDSDSDNASTDHEHDLKSSKAVDDEVTVSVVKGKIMVKKPTKRNKRKGSGKKGRPKGDGYRKEGSGLLFGEIGEGPLAALKKEVDKEASPISPPFSPQNVPSPITIPALKAAPPPPSPPAASKKISPPKPRPGFKDVKPESPLLKDITKARPSPVQIPKPSKLTKSLTKKSPKKSPKVSPTSKRKGNLSPTNKAFPFMDFQSPKTPSPRRSSSPSPSAPSSPMYSPSSSPERVSPLNFQIPATPAFPTRSPPASPLSRQLSTDEDDTDLTPTSVDRPVMPPPSLPPMPPTSAQRRAQRTVITETVGSFVNESGEKIWICPACTMQDDGSPMIGCDICDDWYHWVCVGIKVEPSEDEQWYCQKCKPNGTKAKGSKRGRKKRKS